MKRACSAPSAVEERLRRVQWDNYADGTITIFAIRQSTETGQNVTISGGNAVHVFSVLSGIQAST